ncbi:hypothetical protein MMPV_000576 [Pyropia vietnamensis]
MAFVVAPVRPPRPARRGVPTLSSHRWGMVPGASGAAAWRRCHTPPSFPPPSPPTPCAVGVSMNVVVDLATQAALGAAAAAFAAVTGVGGKKKNEKVSESLVGKVAAKLAGTVLSGGKGGNVRRWGGAGTGLLGGLRNKAGIAAALGVTNAAGVGTTLRTLPPAVKLLVCIGLDGAGFLLGDVADAAYAPVLAAALQGLFGDARVTAAGVAEESVPGRGNVPTATLAWCAEQAGLLRKAEKEEVEKDTAELEAMRAELREMQRGDEEGEARDTATAATGAAAKEKEPS